MALGDNLKDIGSDLKNLNKLGSDLESVFKDIGDGLKDLSKSSNDFKSDLTTAASVSTDISKDARILAGINKDVLKNQKERSKFDDKALKLSQKRTRLESAVNKIKDRITIASDKEAKILSRAVERLEDQVDYTKQIEQGYEDILSTTEQISKINPFESANDFVKDIPILNKVFSDLASATSAFNDELVESGSKTKALGKGFGQLGGLITKGALGFAITGIGKFSEASTDLSRSLNITKEEARGLTSAAIDTGAAISGISGDEIVASQIEFGKALGTNARLTQDLAVQFTTLTKQIGLSADQATELTKVGSTTSEGAEDFTNELIGQVRAQNAVTNSSIRYQDVLADVASTNKAVLVSIEGQGKSLGKAAFEAKRLGLSLNQVDGIAGSLLNFEESIAAELEAELLTGKQLNLEKARQAALNGDLATLASEISKEAGSLEEFQNMNRLQQEAIAKAVGMTREELASSLVEQKALTELGAKDKNELNSKVRLRLQEINAIKDAEKREEARLALVKQLGGEELIRQQENQSTQEAVAEATKETALQMGKMADAIGAIGAIEGAIQKLANAAEMIAIAMTAVAGLSLVSKFGKMSKLFKGMSTSASSLTKSMKSTEKVTAAVMKGSGKKIFGAAAQSAVKAGSATVAKTGGKSLAKTGAKVAAKSAGKTVGKSLLKKIPGVGLIAGLAFAAQKLAEGDLAGAGLEVASGAASLIPGIGTAASLAIDAGIGVRDAKKSMNATETASDFIIQDGKMTKFRKDDVVVGGTNLGGGSTEVISLLERLVSAVENGGTVTLDGQKVGQAMILGSYQLQ
jgi:hypothetical protein